jgi:hypothetical protein
MHQSDSAADTLAWHDLPPNRQTLLQEEYGRYLDTLPPTCDPGTKMERFRHWLAERGIAYSD